MGLTHVWRSLCWEHFSVHWLWFPCPVKARKTQLKRKEHPNMEICHLNQCVSNLQSNWENQMLVVFILPVLTSPAISWKMVRNRWSSSLSSPAEAGAGCVTDGATEETDVIKIKKECGRPLSWHLVFIRPIRKVSFCKWQWMRIRQTHKISK